MVDKKPVKTTAKIRESKAEKTLEQNETPIPQLKKPTRYQGMKETLATAGFWQGMALVFFAVLVMTQLFEIKVTPKVAWIGGGTNPAAVTATSQAAATSTVDTQAINAEVLPEQGVVLPITWGDLGKRMITDGVIDEAKFRALFEGGLSTQDETMLTGNMTQPVIMNQENSRYLLDLLWAFGLANNNAILDTGEMVNKQYGGVANFASTGGWSIGKEAGATYYSKFSYVTLTTDQQALVDTVSQHIFRPCCGNSTHFPDCNHGMAMLGLLELMAKKGASEQEMYKVALQVNSFWFPQTYVDLATYFKEQGKDWSQVDPMTVLGANYSSAQGYQQTRELIKSLPKPEQGGGGCGA